MVDTSMIVTVVAMIVTVFLNYIYKKNSATSNKLITVWNLISAVITQGINGFLATQTTLTAPVPAIAAPTAFTLAAVTATVALGPSIFAQVGSFFVNVALQTLLTTGLHSWPKNFLEGVKQGFKTPAPQ